MKPIFLSIGLGLLCLSGVTLSAETADVIYHNGNLITMDDKQSAAEAVAVKDGKIVVLETIKEGQTIYSAM